MWKSSEVTCVVFSEYIIILVVISPAQGSWGAASMGTTIVLLTCCGTYRYVTYLYRLIVLKHWFCIGWASLMIGEVKWKRRLPGSIQCKPSLEAWQNAKLGRHWIQLKSNQVLRVYLFLSVLSCIDWTIPYLHVTAIFLLQIEYVATWQPLKYCIICRHVTTEMAAAKCSTLVVVIVQF